MSLWVVRAGRHGDQQEVALTQGVVCHGWNELPDYSSCKTRDDLRELYERLLPREKGMKLSIGVGQVWRFAREIQVGDLVALPLKTESSIAVGRVAGPYEYLELAPNVKHIRRVEWLKTFPRSAFTSSTLHAMGSLLTLFKVSEPAEHEVSALLKGRGPQSPTNGEIEQIEQPELTQLAQDEILKTIGERFMGHDMARLVDEVLKAQGYRTFMSPPGPDGGVDILAAPGPLGFEHPRICVQVKSGAIVSDVKVLRELQGVMQKVRAEQGLLVSWGGFTKEAQKEARDSFFSIRLWDQGNLVEAILANYERLDDEIKAELPLKRIWVLVREEEA